MASTLLDKVVNCPTLPSLPSVAMRVLELTRNENVRLDELAGVVEADPALCGKILRTVNSSFYGLTTPCPTISRALAYLGLSTVKSLVLGFSLVEWTAHRNAGLDLIDHWRRSLYGAAAGRRIAMLTRRCDPDEAFVAALMRDVGVLAIVTVTGEDYLKVISMCGGDHATLPQREHEYLGFDHAQAGFGLAEHWRLPSYMVQAILLHHMTDDSTPVSHDMSRIVAMATTASEALGTTPLHTAVARFKSRASEWFSVSDADAEELLHQIARDADALSSLFRMETGEAPDVSAILAAAQEASLAHQLSLQREMEKLRQSNESLTRQAFTDGLTGVANRKRFDEELAHRIGLARSLGGSLALIMTDIDRFKSVNDAHGHQAGDAVLVEFAQRMVRTVGAAGVVCRCGGEEFAIVVPNADRTAGVMLAEKARAALADVPIGLRSMEATAPQVKVTASFGVAIFDAASAAVFTMPALLVQAADKALYAAKDAGRNCVRVVGFKPRSQAA